MRYTIASFCANVAIAAIFVVLLNRAMLQSLEETIIFLGIAYAAVSTAGNLALMRWAAAKRYTQYPPSTPNERQR